MYQEKHKIELEIYKETKENQYKKEIEINVRQKAIEFDNHKDEKLNQLNNNLRTVVNQNDAILQSRKEQLEDKNLKEIKKLIAKWMISKPVKEKQFQDQFDGEINKHMETKRMELNKMNNDEE
jgi:hypothetical protein